MHSLALFVIALTAFHAAADRLSLYLGDHCNNANQGNYEPVELGSCIEFNQAQSYILEKDDGVTYNLYSGGACAQYEGQVTLSGECLAKGDDITGIINIGNQGRRMIRGATRDTPSKATPSNGTVTILTDGDTYQCPNIPSGAAYFLLVQSSSATEEEVPSGDEQTMQNDFLAGFNAAYQNPSGQTQVSTFTPYDGDNFDDVQITLDMQQGVITEFQPQDMAAIVADMFTFRDQQAFPVNFLVSIYTGIPNNPDSGLIASLFFQGD
jgi:hypothetical protein